MTGVRRDPSGRPVDPEAAAARRARINRAKDLVRRAPGLAYARSTVLTAVRGTPAVVAVLDRARGEWPWLGGLARPLHTDPDVAALAGPERPATTWPIVLVVADHLEGDALEAAVEAVAERQRRSLAFRPVFLLLARPSATARVHHYPFDLLSLPEEVDGDDAAYQAYRARRIVSLVDHLGVSLVVRAADADEAAQGLDGEGRLLLDALAEHLDARDA